MMLALPSDLVRMSLTPAISMTARTPPPAMRPVPGAAGFISTSAALNFACTTCGIVEPCMGTRTRFLRAMLAPLRIASGTSFALPMPAPTWPSRSPTTTTAVKLNRRPPLTTFATRLMKTTFSWSSRPVGSIRGLVFIIAIAFSLSEFQAASPGRLGQSLHAAVERVAAPVENHLGYPGLLRPPGDELANKLRGLRLRLAARAFLDILLHIGRRGPRPSGNIVYHLGVDVR